MSEFPIGWNKVPIGSAFSVSSGDMNMTKTTYKSSGFIAFSASGPDGFVEQFQHEGDGIVVSSVGAKAGRVFKSSGRWTAIKNTIVISQKNLLFDINYLFYHLSTEGALFQEGGAQPFVSQKQIQTTEIGFPPLPEQKKIAEILSGIDERIVASQNQEKYYSLLLESTLRDSFSHEADETKTLGEIAEFKSGRAFKSEELSEDGIKVTRISNLHKPNFPYWRYKGEYNPRIVARDGDILFSWAGVANSINVHRYKGENTLLNQHIYNFEFCDQLLKEWTYWNLKTMLPKLRASIEGGAGQLHLTKGFIQSLPIPVIERSRMESLCNCFQSIDHLVEIQKIASTKAKALKTALSLDLLSGSKRVSI